VFFFLYFWVCYSGNRSAFRVSSSSYIVRPSSSCLRKTRSLKAQFLTSPSVKVCAGVCVCPSEGDCFCFWMESLEAEEAAKKFAIWIKLLFLLFLK
jgi:hypothetical protein